MFLVFVSRLDLQSLGVEDKGSTGLGSPWAGLLFGKLAQLSEDHPCGYLFITQAAVKRAFQGPEPRAETTSPGHGVA